MYNEKYAAVYKHTRNQHYSVAKFHSGERNERCCYHPRMQSIISRLFSAPVRQRETIFSSLIVSRVSSMCHDIANRELPGGTRSRATNLTRVNFLHFSRVLDKWCLILRHTEISLSVFIHVKKKKELQKHYVFISELKVLASNAAIALLCYRICKRHQIFRFASRARARKPVWLQSSYSSNGSANGTKTRE